MKRFKSPVTVILTLISVIPLFVGSLMVGSAIWLPLGAFVILLLIHIIFGTPKKSDGAKDEVMEALDKETLETAMKLPIMAGGGRTGSVNPYGRGATYIKKDARYHAGVLSWVVVFAGCFFFTITVNAALFGDKAAVQSELYMPFFLGSAALATGDMASYFLKGKKPVLYRAILAASVILGVYFFCRGLSGLAI